ncbi:hypothetical protein GCM10022380_51720 [Amycolatopsis tucumanensis]|uniref:Uncharacterized protein n=1 Tax=Amycolatopsis tucumanensis TaxID=401106 RepID=A0ABP7ITR2_9PSEU
MSGAGNQEAQIDHRGCDPPRDYYGASWRSRLKPHRRSDRCSPALSQLDDNDRLSLYFRWVPLPIIKILTNHPSLD